MCNYLSFQLRLYVLPIHILLVETQFSLRVVLSAGTNQPHIIDYLNYFDYLGMFLMSSRVRFSHFQRFLKQSTFVAHYETELSCERVTVFACK